MSVGCPQRRKRDGAHCQKGLGHPGHHTYREVELLAPPIKRRVAGHLVCDTCERRVPYQGYVDDSSDWPQHRCGLDIRPFDQLVPDGPQKVKVFNDE